MIAALLDLPAHLRRRLSRALATGLIAPPYSAPILRSTLGAEIPVDDIRAGLEELAHRGIAGPAQATFLDTVDEFIHRTPKPDLVWTGPEVQGLHARPTRAVFEELLGTAEHTLWICSYVVYDGEASFASLARRMTEKPELQVNLLLNVSRPYGDAAPAEELVRRFAERLWQHEWPQGTRRPRVYYDPRALELGPERSVLHAKVVVADDDRLFVTSANLTEAAWDRNIELGVLLRDRALALAAAKNLRALIEQGLLHALPS